MLNVIRNPEPDIETLGYDIIRIVPFPRPCDQYHRARTKRISNPSLTALWSIWDRLTSNIGDELKSRLRIAKGYPREINSNDSSIVQMRILPDGDALESNWLFQSVYYDVSIGIYSPLPREWMILGQTSLHLDFDTENQCACSLPIFKNAMIERPKLCFFDSDGSSDKIASFGCRYFLQDIESFPVEQSVTDLTYLIKMTLSLNVDESYE